VPDSRESRPAVGLGDALSGFAATAVAMLRTRMELATVEFEELTERAKTMLVLVVVATVFGCFALIALSALFVVLLWDSSPVAALLGVALAYAAVTVVALVALRKNALSRPFAATLHELERDAEAIRNKP
jgi:uncharacterized membrane protein YqjE